MDSQRVEAEFLRERAFGWTPLAFVAIVAVGVVDYATGAEITFSPFYLLPVAIVAWLSGPRMASAASLFAAAIWLAAEFASSRLSSTFAYAWNFWARLLFLLLVALLLAKLRQMIVRERGLSRTDALTGLPNARAFREVAEGALARALRYEQPLSLGFVDVDDFKRFNDRRGHRAGDQLLRDLGAFIRGGLRGSDYVARYGGDEFVVLLTPANQEDARAAMDKLRRSMSGLAVAEELPITVSIGVITYEPGGPPVTLEQLLDQADRLMYEVKSRGKQDVRFAMWC